MTIKQAIEQINLMIKQCELYEDTVLQDDNEDMQELLHDTELDIETLRCAVRALESKPRWIPCSERMPEVHKEPFDDAIRVSDVVLISDAGRVRTGCLVCFDDTQRWETYYGLVCEEVTAWMPLPEAYSEED